MKKILLALDYETSLQIKSIIEPHFDDIQLIDDYNIYKKTEKDLPDIIITDENSINNIAELCELSTDTYQENTFLIILKNVNENFESLELNKIPFEYSVIKFNAIDVVSEIKSIFKSKKSISDNLRKKYELGKTLTYLSESYKDLYHSMTDLLFVIAPDGSILDVNSRSCEVLWYNREELLEMNFSDILDTELLDTDENYWDNLGAINEVKEYEIVSKFDKKIPVEINTTLFSFRGKRAILKIARNIIDRKRIERESLSNIYRLETFLHNSPDAYAIFDSNMKYVLCNMSEIKLLNPYSKVVSEADCKECSFNSDRLDFSLLSEYKDVMRTGIPKKFEQSFVHPFKGTVHLQIKAFRIGNELGLIATDSTEFITAKKKYEDFFNYSQDPLIIISPENYKVIEANPSAFSVFKANNENPILERTLLEITPIFQPDGKRTNKLLSEMFKYALKFGSIYFDLQMIRMDQSKFYATLMLSKVIHDEKILVQATVRDVTARKRVQDELKKLSTVIEQSPVSVLITDSKGLIEYVNPKFCEITGYNINDALGKNPSILQSGKTSEETYIELWNTINNGNVWKGELLNKKKNGELYWEDVVISPVLDGNHKITNFLAMKEDITKRKKYQSEKKDLEQQLNQALRLESIGTLAAGIAHEINTPIQFIGNNTGFVSKAMKRIFNLIEKYHNVLLNQSDCIKPTEILEMYKQIDKNFKLQFMQKEVPEAISETLEGVNRVAKIVQAMKNFSHMGSEEEQLENINDAIESTVIISKNEWKYVADVKTELEPDLPKVKCVIGDIKQVLLNLIVNSSHAIKDKVDGGIITKGLIKIKTFSDSDSVNIIISDNGTGIPEHIQNRIYEPFFTTKEVGRGTGQGLSIAYQSIVERHKGELSFNSVTGEGTEFIIKLYIDGSDNQLNHTLKLYEKLEWSDND